MLKSGLTSNMLHATISVNVKAAVHLRSGCRAYLGKKKMVTRRMSVIARRLRAIASVTIIASACVAASNAAAADKPYTLGISMPFLGNSFMVVQANLLADGAKKAAVKALPVTNADRDAGKQITDFHNLIGLGARGIIVVATDSEAIIPALNFAASQDVPVVSIDIGPAGGKAAMIIRANNYKMGEDAAMATGKALGGKGSALSLMGDLATVNGRDRSSGYRDCLAKNFPNIKLIEKPTYWKSDVATAITQTIVTATPDLGAIYMQTDAGMIAGVLNVLKSADKLKKVGEPGHVFLVGIDGSPQALHAVRDGWLDLSISQPLDLYVKYGLEYLQGAVNGKTYAQGPTDHDSEVVMFNGNPMDLLPAPLVTTKNVDDKNLWGNQVKE
jgi:ribose transport system substrate-binding protein